MKAQTKGQLKVLECTPCYALAFYGPLYKKKPSFVLLIHDHLTKSRLTMKYQYQWWIK